MIRPTCPHAEPASLYGGPASLLHCCTQPPPCLHPATPAAVPSPPLACSRVVGALRELGHSAREDVAERRVLLHVKGQVVAVAAGHEGGFVRRWGERKGSNTSLKMWESGGAGLRQGGARRVDLQQPMSSSTAAHEEQRAVLPLPVYLWSVRDLERALEADALLPCVRREVARSARTHN